MHPTFRVDAHLQSLFLNHPDENLGGLFGEVSLVCQFNGGADILGGGYGNGLPVTLLPVVVFLQLFAHQLQPAVPLSHLLQRAELVVLPIRSFSSVTWGLSDFAMLSSPDTKKYPTAKRASLGLAQHRLDAVHQLAVPVVDNVVSWQLNPLNWP